MPTALADRMMHPDGPDTGTYLLCACLGSKLSGIIQTETDLETAVSGNFQVSNIGSVV